MYDYVLVLVRVPVVLEVRVVGEGEGGVEYWRQVVVELLVGVGEGGVEYW